MTLLRRTLVPVTIAVIALAGCSKPAQQANTPSSPPSSPPTSQTMASGATLKVVQSSLGKIVADAKGRTVYRFDLDSKGTTKSACAAACLREWIPVHADGKLAVDGSSVGTASITGPDGKKQITVDGWPVYYYNDDAKPGDVEGEGKGGVWWAVGTDGSRVKSKPATQKPSSAATSPSGGYNY